MTAAEYESDRHDGSTPEANVVDVMMAGDTERRSGIKGLRRAIGKFLAVPFLMVLVFLLAAVVLHILERSDIGWVHRLRATLQGFLFADAKTTGSFLEVAGGGMVTLTSITISMLLLVLQQTAGNMGNMVYDQFLTRRRNQVYAGFIVGGAALPIFLRGTVTETFNPVLGATFVLLTMTLALVGLLWFLYMTIDQMRPSTVVNDIAEKTRKASQRYRHFIERTRRTSLSDAPVRAVLRARRPGYVTDIDLEMVEDCLKDQPEDVEIVNKTLIGSYISYSDPVADVKARREEDGRRVADRLGEAYYVEQRRQLDDDPRFGLKQLEMIAWTEGATAKQNPETVLMVIRALRDLISRWALDADEVTVDESRVALVYDDTVLPDALGVLESLAVVSSESLQHQAFAEVLQSLAVIYGRLPERFQRRTDDNLMRALSAMGDHVLTRDLELAIERLAEAIRAAGHGEAAQALVEAGSELRASVGKLASRSTRVKAGG